VPHAILAVDVLHREEVQAVLDIDVDHTRDMGVIE
jgi:hypothetical protein